MSSDIWRFLNFTFIVFGMSTVCLLHYADANVSTVRPVSAAGAESTKKALKLHREKGSGAPHDEVIRNLDALPEKYPWTGMHYHRECHRKFTKVYDSVRAMTYILLPFVFLYPAPNIGLYLKRYN